MKKGSVDQPLPTGFFDLAEQVYADDPQWIPEDQEKIRKAFHADNPWFLQGEAKVFCIEDKARAAVFFRPDLTIDAQSAAFFGYWETVGDEPSDSELMREVEAWARNQGAQTLFGPINFSTYGNYRLRVGAESHADTFVGEPHNPPEYPEILTRLGFEEHQHYCSLIWEPKAAAPLIKYKGPVRERLLADGFHIEPLTRDYWMANLPELHVLVDVIFQANFAYTPLTYEAFEEACGGAFANKLCPQRSFFARAPNGDIAGFLLLYPHYGPLVVKGAGENRVNEADLDYRQHTPLLDNNGLDAAVFKTVGVNPAYRRCGVMDSLIVTMIEHTMQQCQRWFGAMIRADNPSRRFGEHETSGKRWYALYRKKL